MTEENKDINSELLAEIHSQQTKAENRDKIRTAKEWMFGIISALIMFGLLTFVIFQEVNHRKEISKTIMNFTKVERNFYTKDLTKQERQSRFRRMMMRIFAVYGFEYAERNEKKQAMSPIQQAEYIDFVFETSEFMGYGLFDVPGIHCIESGFNPYAHNTNCIGELGMGQQLWETALLAESVLQFMPEAMRKRLEFHLKSPQDLFDWKVSTKATFALLWWNNRKFQGRQDWVISVYHFGGYLSQYYMNGDGQPPIAFTLNGVVRPVIGYYLKWAQLVAAWDNGDIEAGREIIREWEIVKQKLMEEEIRLQTSIRIIKKLRKSLEQKRQLESDLVVKYKEIDVMLDDAYSKLWKIYRGAAKQKTGEAIREKLKQHRKVVTDLLDRLKKEEASTNVGVL